MSAAPSPLKLRLVNDAPRAIHPRRAPALHAAPALSDHDARWVLALRVQDALQGGPAAILPPEARSRLVHLGHRLGLRTFDVSLIIAIVQDHARCGRRSSSSDFIGRLLLVPVPGAPIAPAHSRLWWTAWAASAVGLAAIMAVSAALWLLN